MLNITQHRHTDRYGHEHNLFMAGSKQFVIYFYNHNKTLYNKFEFLKN